MEKNVNRAFIVSLSLPVRKELNEIVSSQVADLHKSKSVNLSLSVEDTEKDTPLVASIKKQLLDAKERTIERLGGIGADLIQSTTATNEALVSEAKDLRRRADALLAQARTNHNAQQYMLNTGDALPLALALDIVDTSSKSLVAKHVEAAKVPDYFGNQNPKKAK